MFACQYEFSSEKICNAFDEAINAPKFKNFEKVGIIDEEFKKQLLQNRQVMLHCIANKQDKLRRIEEVAVEGVGFVSTVVIAGIPALASGLVGAIIGGVADIVVKPFKKSHKMGTYTWKCTEKGASGAAIIPFCVIISVAMGASIAIKKGVEVSSKFKDKNYSRWQLPSSFGFSTKLKLIEANNLIPLFDNSQNVNQHCQDLHFDQQLLSLSSSKKLIVLIIETKRSVKSLIRYAGHDLYVIRMSWNDDIYSAKMFYSLYCITNLVIWKGDTMVECKRFEAFVEQLQTDIHTKTCNNAHITCPKHHLLWKMAHKFYVCDGCHIQYDKKDMVHTLHGCVECNFLLCNNCYSLKDSSNRKPAFLYFCHTEQAQTDEPELLEITKNAFFESFCGLNMFSSIFGYVINKNQTKSVINSAGDNEIYNIVNSAGENSQRFVTFPFECEKSKSDYYKCPACSKIIDISM
eukprot:503821_1